MAFSPHDVVLDSPLNNFATINPLQSSRDGFVISKSNLQVSIPSTSSIRGNFYVSTGKWYYEVYVHTLNNLYLGLAANSKNPTNYVADEAFGVNNGGGILQNTAGSTYGTSLGSIALAANSIYGIFFDADAKLFWISKNGQWYSCNSATGTTISKTDVESGSYGYDFNALSGDAYTSNFGNSTASGALVTANFGQDPTFAATVAPATTYIDSNGIGLFNYEPPAGAKALCTANIPEGPIKLSEDQTPSDHFKAVTYTGNGVGGSQSIRSVGFQPDLIWCKGTGISSNHRIHDTVRGVGSTLSSNQTSGEDQTNGLGGVLSNGFNLISSSNVNQSFTYVAWCWRAAGSPDPNQAKIINADGTQADTTCAVLATAAGGSNVITPSKISANRQNGFSIVQYLSNGIAGALVPHGLSYKPEFIIIKNLSESTNWTVYHDKVGASKKSFLNSTAQYTSGVFNYTEPTSSYFTLGGAGGSGETNGFSNSSMDYYIAYCWHSVAGYSKIGSYIGNGSADGPYVHCGFRPAWVMAKCVDGTVNTDYYSWCIWDNARKSYNPADHPLFANSSVDEEYRGNLTTSSGGYHLMVDFLSNGFKVRNDAGTPEINVDGATYIYMAFAEQPFSGPSNAR
jgi:hypothetical protein